MPDAKQKRDNESPAIAIWRYILPAIIIVVLGVMIFAWLATIQISLQDRERFSDDVSLALTPADDEANQFIARRSSGTLSYALYENPDRVFAESVELYPDRQSMESGSPLAQSIAGQVSSVTALEIHPDHLLVTYAEGRIREQVLAQIEDALNDFYPRTSLRINLWLFGVELGTPTIITIYPIETQIPLFLFVLFYGLVEIGLAIWFRNRNDYLFRPIVRVVGIFLIFWSIFGHEPLWDYILSIIFPTSRQLVHPNATVIEFAAQQLDLIIVSSLITVPLGIGIGILVTRAQFRELLPLVTNLVNSGQTVPTIAIVAVMAPLIGFGFWPAIIALVAYGLLFVVRNTIAGIEGVDPFIVDSARGMGMTPVQVLLRVELPLAFSVIMAGVRTTMVVNVGTATLGAFVGSGGLGTPIASGLAMTIDAFVLLGAIPAAMMAILIDYILGRFEYIMTPRGLQVES